MAEAFYYYTQMAPTSYGVTVKLTVTAARKALKQAGYRFFPAYLYVVTETLRNHPALRVGMKEGVLGHWNCLTPAYPQFHQDTETTSLLWTAHDDSFPAFHRAYLEDTARYGQDHGIITSKGIPPENAYIISCIPWFTFESFALQNHGIKDYYVPSLEAGGFVEENGRVQMPLSVTVHHGTTDGYHLHCFFQELQARFDAPEKWLP